MGFKTRSCLYLCLLLHLHLTYNNLAYNHWQGPCGVLICRNRCLQVKGCMFYSFSQRYLMCFLKESATSISDAPASVLFELKQEALSPTDQSCKAGNTVLLTARRQFRCVSSPSNSLFLTETKTTEVQHEGRMEETVGDEKTSRSPQSSSWLLIVRHGFQKPQLFLQLAPHDLVLKLTPTSFMAFTNIRAMCYRKSRQQLFIVHGDPRAPQRQMISEFSLPTNTSRSLGNVRSVDTLAVHDQDGTTFYFDKKPAGYIYKLKNNSGKKRLTTDITSVLSMAIAPETRFLFIYTRRSLRMCSFNGDQLYAYGGRMKVFAFDPSGDYLYHYGGTKNCVLRRTMFKNDSRCVIGENLVTNIAVDSSRIYLKHMNIGINIFNLSTYEPIRSFYKLGVEKHLMCLIDRT